MYAKGTQVAVPTSTNAGRWPPSCKESHNSRCPASWIAHPSRQNQPQSPPRNPGIRMSVCVPGPTLPQEAIHACTLSSPNLGPSQSRSRVFRGCLHDSDMTHDRPTGSAARRRWGRTEERRVLASKAAGRRENVPVLHRKAV